MIVSLFVFLFGVVFVVQFFLMGVLEGEIEVFDYYVVMGVGVVFIIGLVLFCIFYLLQEVG